MTSESQNYNDTSADSGSSSSDTNIPSSDLPPPPFIELPKTKRCKVYSREEWAAVPPQWEDKLKIPVKRVVVSRTETEPCFTEYECKLRVKQIQTAHMLEEGVPDIKYNFLVGGDGALYEGRGYDVVGPKYPTSPKKLQCLTGMSIDIAFIEQMDNATTELMQKAVSDCISIGIHGNFIQKRFDLYWVANNEIQHVEYFLGEMTEAEMEKEMMETKKSSQEETL